MLAELFIAIALLRVALVVRSLPKVRLVDAAYPFQKNYTNMLLILKIVFARSEAT